MSTELLSVVKLHGKKLRQSAPDNYWSMLAQLYRFHRSTHDLEPLGKLIRGRDFSELLDLADSWSTQKYTTAHEHFVRNQFAYLIKKYVLPSKYDPEANAVKKFHESERTCARTNRRFITWSIDEDFGKSPTRQRYNNLLRKMRAYIAYVIGNEPDLNSILSKVGFGPGASLGVNGRATNAMRKLTAKSTTVTPRAFTYFVGAVANNLWLRRKYFPDPDGFSNGTADQLFKSVLSNMEFVRYNKIAFVPKTAKVLRAIAVEPLGNSIIQKGADEVLKQFLKRVGVDLRDQTVNQRFAREGSLELTPGIATVDLRAASDNVAQELVKVLFPPAWFEFLNSIRCELYMLPGEEICHKYEKFCSMGNGTCFPIESLIFTAACHAIGCGNPGKDFAVYGDDIAIPAHKARDLLRLLKVLGHTANTEKTFIKGPFRESCGEDWFGGVRVRPFVLDYGLDSVQNVFKFLNQTREHALWADFFEPVRSFILRLLPLNLRFYRPFMGAVDSGINAVSDEYLTCAHCRYLGNGVWSWRELTSRPLRDVGYNARSGESTSELPDYVRWYGVHTLTGGINTLDGRAVRATGEFPSWFTLRRAVRTAITRESGGGAASNWLPSSGKELLPHS